MPTRAEIETAITHHKATLDQARAEGIDGPAVWAVEARMNELVESLAEAD